MRKPYLLRIIKLAVVLLVLLVPFMGNYKGAAIANLSDAQYAESCRDYAANCKAPVKYLGDKTGCSCYACEYGRKTQKILCSNDWAEKTKFRALLPKTRTVK